MRDNGMRSMRSIRVSSIAAALLLVLPPSTAWAQTPVTGPSVLEHLHRDMGNTSMGRSSSLLGPPPTEVPPRIQVGPLPPAMVLAGSDLYRLKCRGCHGPAGEGAPPEINSIINPVRATSAATIMKRMRERGASMSHRDAAVLARQSASSLSDRLHKGGTDMPTPGLAAKKICSAAALPRPACRIVGKAADHARINLARRREPGEVHLSHLSCGGGTEPHAGANRSRRDPAVEHPDLPHQPGTVRREGHQGCFTSHGGSRHSITGENARVQLCHGEGGCRRLHLSPGIPAPGGRTTSRPGNWSEENQPVNPVSRWRATDGHEKLGHHPPSTRGRARVLVLAPFDPPQ
jgi:hypothetical protein